MKQVSSSLNSKKVFLLLLAFAAISFCLWFFSSNIPSSSSLATCSQDKQIIPAAKRKMKILFAILAVGAVVERNDIVKANLQVVRDYKNSKDTTLQVECRIFAYAAYKDLPEFVKEMERDRSPNALCKVTLLYKMGFNGILKFLDPELLKEAGYDYVTISLDDVGLTQPYGNFIVKDYYNLISRANLSVSSPGVWGTGHKAMHPNTYNYEENGLYGGAGIVGRFVECVEVQFITISVQNEVWKCWHELIDLESPHGWQDSFVYDYCVANDRGRNWPASSSSSVDTSDHLDLNASVAILPNPHIKMGIIDIFHVTQLSFPSTHDSDGGASIWKYLDSQTLGWAAERGIQLKGGHLPKTNGRIFQEGIPFSLPTF